MSVTRVLHCRLLPAVFATLIATGAFAADVFKQGSIEISQARSRPTAVGQTIGSGYLTLRNTGAAADRLVAASAPIATSVEMHSMRMEGDVMRMRQIDAIDLPAGQSIELKPGGLHLMLTGLKGPLKAGSRYELTLVFEKSGTATIPVKVGGGAAAATHRH